MNLAKVPSLRLTSATAVRDMAFMHGFTEPLLVLLHETTPTWGGRWVGGGSVCVWWSGVGECVSTWVA